MTAIEDMELGALVEFRELQKKVERGDRLSLTPVWVDRPGQKVEGCRKSDRHRIGARPISGGGGRDAVFNHKVDPQLRIIERLRYMMAAARSEKLRNPLAADGREICLHFISKGYCIRSYMR